MNVIPTLIIAVGLYNALAFLMPDSLTSPLLTLPLLSGQALAVNAGELIICLAVLLLFVEIVKATRTGGATAIDHALSLLLFVGCLIEFLAVPQTGTAVFMIITLMTLLDVIAGFTISLSTARRDLMVGGSGGGL
ncbi:hypothetical protein [Paucidesulfovibrio longus]|uniref:hypothetical protein n=1 Tax=Paucidesulfovibrio longus TaxID=889 RepID=UPI0003B39E82|nr:hypothetical protein [Paucidesulfovibrio longus]